MDSLILIKNPPNLEDTIEPVGRSATFLNAIVRRRPLKEGSCMFSISRSLALAPVVCLLISAVVAHAEDIPKEQSPALPPELVEFITSAEGSAPGSEKGRRLRAPARPATSSPTGSVPGRPEGSAKPRHSAHVPRSGTARPRSPPMAPRVAPAGGGRGRAAQSRSGGKPRDGRLRDPRAEAHG